MALGALAFIFFLLGILAKNGLLAALAAPFVAYMAALSLARPRQAKLFITRDVSPLQAERGQDVEIRLTIRNLSNRSIFVLVDDELPSGLALRAGSPSMLLKLAADASSTVSYRVAGQRGSYKFQTIRVSAAGAFGSLGLPVLFPVPGEFQCNPRQNRIPALPILPRKTLLYHGPLSSGVPGEGTEFFDAREYREGDSMRRLNWAASARHPEDIFVTDFERQRITEIGIILDGRTARNPLVGGASIFEHTVEAATALSRAFLEDGHRVGLVVIGTGLHWVAPGYGKRQAQRILEELGTAEEGDSAVFKNLDAIPLRVLPSGCQVIIISPLSDGDGPALSAMVGRGYSVIVLSPDPLSARPGPGGKTREALLGKRLARMERGIVIAGIEKSGCPVIDWDINSDLADCLGRSLPRLRALRALGRQRLKR